MKGIVQYITEKAKNGYWNEETCREEAKKYKTRGEFQKGSKSAWAAARIHGWLDDYDWFVNGRKQLDKETCLKYAKECSSRGEFAKKYSGAYKEARKNGWLEDYTWLEKKLHTWTKEECEELAQQCKSKNDFQMKHPSAYGAAYRNKWLNDFNFSFSGRNAGYWDKEKCERASKECSTRTEFSKKYVAAYVMARKNGWLDDYTWLKDARLDDTRTTHSVYRYVFKKDGEYAIYIGLTTNVKRRDREHLFDDKDAVYKYAKENDLVVPKCEVLEKGITAGKAQEREEYWYQFYKKQGFHMLNRGKTGSLGGFAFGKWNEKTCYDAAKKCSTIGEFQDKYSGAYGAARKNGWMKDYTWFNYTPRINPNKKWDKEKCYNAAKECTSRSDFQYKYGTAYRAALKNGWLDDYDWFEVKMGKWNEETCREVALTCKTRSEFRNTHYQAYEIALKNGWLDDYDWFDDGRKRAGQARTKWNEETCREEAKKYNTRKEFAKGSSGAYEAARKNGWLNDYDWFEERKKTGNYWNEETCREEAKKYKTRSEFKKGAVGAWTVANKNGWLDDYDWFVKGDPNANRRKWNEETCREEAKKYKTRGEFKKGSNSAWAAARIHGWLDDYTWLSNRNWKSNQFKHLKECLVGTIKPLYSYLNNE